MATRKGIFGAVLFLLLAFLLVSLAWASSRFFEVDETDFVRLRAEGYDADDDQITYTYSPPLNEKGEWQTTYGDAGEYQIEIKASDGEKETTEKATLIVRNKNQPPRLAENKMVVKETQTADLKVMVEDPDNDFLKFTFKEPFDRSGRWKTDYNDAGIYLADFTAGDGEFTEEFRAEIEVVNTDRPMRIIDIFAEPFDSLETAEGETLAYWVEVEPAEGKGKEEVKYRWMLDAKLISEEPAGEYYFDYNRVGGDGGDNGDNNIGDDNYDGYDSVGEHLLKLEISQNRESGGSRESGEDEETKEIKESGDKAGERIIREWEVRVMNTNRAPELSFLPVIVKEGEKIVLELPETDLDGDTLSYSIDAPLEEGRWRTDHFSAGEYKIKISASDGELSGESILNVTILNVDRPPSLELPQTVELWEGREFQLKIETEDPDRDELRIAFEELPDRPEESFEEFLFDEENRTLVLKPSYETIKRSEGWFSNILNALRLESLMLRQTAVPLKIISCGAELCSAAEVRLIINNVNRPPAFEPLNDALLTGTLLNGTVLNDTLSAEPLSALSVRETEEFSFASFGLKAVDPDGDVLNYYYSPPLDRTSGRWKTDYGDAGFYQVNVTASDGKLETTLPIQINILKSNRAPSLKIKKDKFTLNEGEEFSFSVEAADPDEEDEEELTITLADNLAEHPADYPAGISFKEGIFTWRPGFEVVGNRTSGGWNDLISGSAVLNRRFNQDKETVWLNFAADDGEIRTEHPVRVTIKNVNQGPQIMDYLPPQETKVKVGEPVLFHLAVKDLDEEDKERLEYTWSFGLGQGKVKGTDTVKRTFLSPGKKKVKVEVTDGLEKVEHQWSIEVEEAEEAAKPAAEEPVSLEPAAFKVYVIRS